MAWASPILKARKQMMAEIARICQQVGEVDMDWLIGFCGRTWGLSPKGIISLLDQLAKTGEITIENDNHRITYRDKVISAKAKDQTEPALPEQYRLPTPTKKKEKEEKK